MRVTKRDVDLLRWVNSLGHVNINHIINRYKIAKVTAYARLRKLIAEQLLLHEFLLHNEPGHYRVTNKGVAISNDELPPLKRVVHGSYTHDNMVAALSVLLAEKYQCEFISERQLRQQQGITLRGDKVHISDGVLKLPEGDVAIEVELSTKGQQRLSKIMQHYMRSFGYKEVWYFCSTGEVENLINKAAKEIPFVKVFRIGAFLQVGELA